MNELLIKPCCTTVCFFRQGWAQYNQQRGLSQSEQDAAAGRNMVPYFSRQVHDIQAAVAGSGVSMIDVVAVSAIGGLKSTPHAMQLLKMFRTRKH